MKIELMGNQTILVNFTANDADEVIRKKLLIALLLEKGVVFTEHNNQFKINADDKNLALVRNFYNEVMPTETEINFAGYFIYLKHHLENAKIGFNPDNNELIANSKLQRCQTFSEESHNCAVYYFLYANQLSQLTTILAADHHKFKDHYIKRRIAVGVTINNNYCILLLNIDHGKFLTKDSAQIELTLLLNTHLIPVEKITQMVQLAYESVLPISDVKTINLNKYSTEAASHWKLAAQAVGEWLKKDYLFLSARGDSKGDSLPAMGGLAKTPTGNFDIKSASTPNTPLLSKRDDAETGCTTSCVSCSIM